jgi:hypothetical protein
MTLTLDAREKPTVVCVEGAETIWTIPVESLVILAEYTNSKGPFEDDYFLVFGYRENGQCCFRQATFYSIGTEVVLAQLSVFLRDELRFGLCNSTDWKSRVIWPRQLVDQEYLTLTEMKPRSIWQRLRKIWIGREYRCSISAHVKFYLDNAGSLD